MDNYTLNQKLHGLKTAGAGSLKLLENLFVPVSFKKGTVLSVPDHSFPILYYIESGLVRGYFSFHQEEYTSWIVENGFLLPSEGFFSKEPGLECVQFLKDTVGWSLNLARAEAMVQKEPTMYRILLEIYEESLHHGKSRELMLRLTTASARLFYAEKSNGNLLYKIGHDILASFLNIESRYLYKIMKKGH